MESKKSVKIWEESCIIPTYPVCPPEKSPLFIEKRAYQGSTGKVYPLPVTEKISAISRIRSTPLWLMSSRRPRKGDTKAAPALAASSA